MIGRENLAVRNANGERLELVLRTLEAAEYEQCEDLQIHTWGEDFREIVPASMMMINQKLSGVLAGAFDPEGRLLAFVFGQTGLRDRRPFHWSHMLAVRSELRGSGLGRHLKLYQRRFLLDLGVEEVEWTYDPLESRNAHLNLNRLGAEPVEYLRDVYGDGSTSSLHSGIGTDRFVVSWKLRDREVEERIAGRSPERSADLEAPVVNADDRGRPLASPRDLPEAAVLRLEVPSDIQIVKTESMDVARRWRESTRSTLETCLGRGYRIPRFVRDPRSRRSFYVLVRP